MRNLGEYAWYPAVTGGRSGSDTQPGKGDMGLTLQ
jgi:hypothetical protein